MLAGVPQKQDFDAKEYMLRKTIKLYKAFPIQQDEITMNYDNGDAGKFKSKKVTLAFDSYRIEYNNKVKGINGYVNAGGG